MSVDRKLLKNTQNSFQILAQKGGRGRSATFDSLNRDAVGGLGKFPSGGVLYDTCNTQGGGGYGFTKDSVADADAFRGSYPAYVKYEKGNQCGGRRRRKSRRRRRSRKSRRRRRSRRGGNKCCKTCKKLCGKKCKKMKKK